jgi:hypothetical protein
VSTSDEAFIFLHVLAAIWYAAGLTSVQLALVRGWQTQEVGTRVVAFSEALHYQGLLLVPGAIAVATTGLFLWGQLDYNFASWTTTS